MNLKYLAIGTRALIVVLSVLAIASCHVQAAPVQVVNDVHFLSSGSNVAIVPLSDHEALLVDTGMFSSAKKVLAELAKMGMNADSVTTILFTHGHFDHIKGAKAFKKAELMSLATEADLIAGKVGTHGLITRLFPVKPTGLTVARQLQDGEVFNIGHTVIKVFAVPGHTAGSAAYLINGILFIGDSANAKSSGKLKSAVGIFSDDIDQNHESLRKLEKQLHDNADQVQAIAFGHADPLIKGLSPLTDWVEAHPK